MNSSMPAVRVGTRASLLARTQSGLVVRDLQTRWPDLKVELVEITTTGDVVLDRPLHELGGKGLFIKELELAVLEGRIDLAVHSYKDVPVTMPLVAAGELCVAAVPIRQDVRDVLAMRGPAVTRLADLPAGAHVGTGSLRRQCQLMEKRPDLRISPIRGNIDTRLRKLRAGEFDAVVLAMAGLLRCGLFDAATMGAIDTGELMPAAGQGALSLQCRRSDTATLNYAAALSDAASAECVNLERDLVARLAGDCHSPIGSLARIEGDQIHLSASVGARGGQPPVVRATGHSDRGHAAVVADQVFSSLVALGAMDRLHGGDRDANIRY
jgi:hydroxymethylbilane synthase